MDGQFRTGASVYPVNKNPDGLKRGRKIEHPFDFTKEVEGSSLHLVRLLVQ